MSDEVVITDERIEHIQQQRADVYSEYKDRMPEIVESPDVVIEDPKNEDTIWAIKGYDKHALVVIKLNTSQPGERKNSIITMWKVQEKNLRRYLRTKKVLYKRE
jgi:hypothetical protein